jgi:hypothetical protein
MSHEAACTAYATCEEELNKLVDSLRNAGVDVDPLEEEINKQHHQTVVDMVRAEEALHPLISAATNWQYAFECMNEEEWNESWMESVFDEDMHEQCEDGGMHCGISDDWEEYLDMIYHDLGGH